MRIGFIGLGIMGKPMVKNLLKAGHDLIVYDIVKENVENAVAAGAVAAPSSKAVAEQCMHIITMLPNSPHVKEAVSGPAGVLEGLQKGAVLIDMSSIDPLASKEIAALVEAKGGHMIDAPVSGGEPKAIEGTLSIMVGGDEAVFQQVKPILESMGTSITLCGGIGAGNTTKLANQIVVAANIAAVGEALVFGKLAGVDPEAVYKAIRGGLAGSTVMDAKAPMMLSGNFEPGFRVGLHSKDLKNALDTGKKIAAATPLTEKVMEMLQWLESEGKSGEDHSALVKYYEHLAGIDIRKA